MVLWKNETEECQVVPTNDTYSSIFLPLFQVKVLGVAKICQTKRLLRQPRVMVTAPVLLPKTPHLAPSDLEEQQLYSKNLLNDQLCL